MACVARRLVSACAIGAPGPCHARAALVTVAHFVYKRFIWQWIASYYRSADVLGAGLTILGVAYANSGD
jgi:hypothetical protein